ncbi:MAG: YoaK family protein [Bdellovibrionota bacterium]
MFSHRFNEQVSSKTYFDWFLLSFLAGNINTGGYLSCHRFVSHVTGFATLAGISLEEGAWLEALGAVTIPLFFLMGVMLSAFLTERNRTAKVHGQKYAPVMGLVALLIGFVAIGGTYNLFGAFGETANIKYDFLLLACLCGACGLQNAAISSASGATIRTTHLTGITTDLGLGLVRAEIHNLNPDEKKQERRSNYLKIATIVSFTLGSAVGALVFSQFKYQGFFFPMCIAMYLAWMARNSH